MMVESLVNTRLFNKDFCSASTPPPGLHNIEALRRRPVMAFFSCRSLSIVISSLAVCSKFLSDGHDRCSECDSRFTRSSSRLAISPRSDSLGVPLSSHRRLTTPRARPHAAQASARRSPAVPPPPPAPRHGLRAAAPPASARPPTGLPTCLPAYLPVSLRRSCVRSCVRLCVGASSRAQLAPGSPMRRIRSQSLRRPPPRSRRALWRAG
mmetsp:Transcript_8780/g.16102  ORF Transcript_8780/g.16102 Transcript_8780/m.16102 type:complete len:209 (+) Transcript_8780:703-1329(+)